MAETHMNAHPDWSLRAYALAMAQYNLWMNDKVYEAAATLSDEQRKANRQAFFKSIHGTLNHLLLGDRSWMQRLHGQPVTMTSARDELHSDFDALRAARAEMDQTLLSWADGLSAEDESRAFSFFSVTYQQQISLPFAGVVMQIFNHQTHHRGQVTTLLTQLGADVGVTDIPVMPYWQD
jgi:uncharacterized damage-inducible protein DinB